MSDRKFDPDIVSFLADDLAAFERSDPAAAEERTSEEAQAELIDSLPPSTIPPGAARVQAEAEETIATTPTGPEADQPELFTSALSEPAAATAHPHASSMAGVGAADMVTMLEVATPEEGGMREVALPGDRSHAPVSPVPGRRAGLNHPVARAITYTVIVIALTIFFLVVLVNIFHLG